MRLMLLSKQSEYHQARVQTMTESLCQPGLCLTAMRAAHWTVYFLSRQGLLTMYPACQSSRAVHSTCIQHNRGLVVPVEPQTVVKLTCQHTTANRMKQYVCTLPTALDAEGHTILVMQGGSWTGFCPCAKRQQWKDTAPMRCMQNTIGAPCLPCQKKLLATCNQIPTSNLLDQ